MENLSEIESPQTSTGSEKKFSFQKIDREHLNNLIAREKRLYLERNPKSLELFSKSNNLFGKVPMTWMNKFSGGFPMFLDKAFGNKIKTVDQHNYLDFALGDTGSMTGHSPIPTI